MPLSPARHISASATARPPSEQSCAALTTPWRIAASTAIVHARLALQVDVQLAADEAVLELQVLAAAERVLRLLDVRADDEHLVALVLREPACSSA